MTIATLRRDHAEEAALDPLLLAEQAVLGGLLLDNSAWYRIADLVAAGDFNRHGHHLIFEAIARLIDKSRPADPVTVYESLHSAGKAEEAGGLPYLNALAQNTPSAANVGAYAATVAQHAQQRRARALFKQAGEAAERGELEEAARIVSRIERHVRRAAKPMDWEDLAQQPAPARDWIVDHWITGGLTLIAGRGGVGKSLLSQQLGTAIAIARAFIGQVAQPRRVLLWNCEDDHDELWRRQSAICSHFGITLDDLKNRLILVPRVGHDNTMMSVAYGAPTFTEVLAELAADVARHRAEFVILDNIACVFAADSNNPGHVRMFVNGLLGAIQQVPVGLIGHTARASGSEFSGSAQWEAAARTRLYLGPTLPDQQPSDEADADDEGIVYLARRKANYSSRDWVRMTFDAGRFVPDQPTPEPGGMNAALRQQQARRVVMHSFDRLVKMGKQPTDGASSPDYLPRLIAEHKLAEGLNKKQLAEAMRDLMTEGKFQRKEVGQYANRAPRFGLAKV